MKYRKSPLNYSGGKHRSIGELLPLFPEKINAFVDLFCGGLNVSLNAGANRYWANDLCAPLMQTYQYLRETREEAVFARVESLLHEYSLPEDRSFGGDAGYYRLREGYNRDRDPSKLIVLVANSYNHQIRFNSRGDFNISYGRDRSYFNPAMRENLSVLIRFLHENDVSLTTKDFRECGPFSSDQFLFIDPPYSMSVAVYNTGWTAQDDADLLSLLSEADRSGVRFAFTCLLNHHGRKNVLLEEWAKPFNVHTIRWNHSNSCYQKKEKSARDTQEVCITNYSQEASSLGPCPNMPTCPSA